MDLQPLVELSTMAYDSLITDLTTPLLFMYAFTLDDMISFFVDLSMPVEVVELSEMSGTMTNLT